MKTISERSPSAERIINAAQDLIQAVGYNGFSYEDIAKIVGIRKSSIHHHFPSKADLGSTVVQRYTERFIQKLTEIDSIHTSSIARLKEYAKLFEETYTNEQRLCICGMLGAEANSLPEQITSEIHSFFSQNLVWLTKIFKESIATKETLAHGNPKGLAECFLATLEGSMVLGRGSQSTNSPQRIAKIFFSLIET